jgi:hypothetical protein
MSGLQFCLAPELLAKMTPDKAFPLCNLDIDDVFNVSPGGEIGVTDVKLDKLISLINAVGVFGGVNFLSGLPKHFRESIALLKVLQEKLQELFDKERVGSLTSLKITVNVSQCEVFASPTTNGAYCIILITGSL